MSVCACVNRTRCVKHVILFSMLIWIRSELNNLFIHIKNVQSNFHQVRKVQGELGCSSVLQLYGYCALGESFGNKRHIITPLSSAWDKGEKHSTRAKRNKSAEVNSSLCWCASRRGSFSLFNHWDLNSMKKTLVSSLHKVSRETIRLCNSMDTHRDDDICPQSSAEVLSNSKTTTTSTLSRQNQRKVKICLLFKPESPGWDLGALPNMPPLSIVVTSVVQWPRCVLLFAVVIPHFLLLFALQRSVLTGNDPPMHLGVENILN